MIDRISFEDEAGYKLANMLERDLGLRKFECSAQLAGSTLVVTMYRVISPLCLIVGDDSDAKVLVAEVLDIVHRRYAERMSALIQRISQHTVSGSAWRVGPGANDISISFRLSAALAPNPSSLRQRIARRSDG